MSDVWTLLLHLEGPMQSWGYRSRFDYRDTALEPTRSGVIGLICAAMGIARDDPLSRFNSIRMGIRVDKEGKIERDYHTALDVVKADGSEKDTVVSLRDYLADAIFTVGLESTDRSLLEQIAADLKSPCWTLFLGRKAFPLTVPPLKPSDVPMEGKLENHLLKGEGDKRVILEDPSGERTQHDWPLNFDKRNFMPRTTNTRFIKEIAP